MSRERDEGTVLRSIGPLITWTPEQISWASSHIGVAKREVPTKEVARSKQKRTTLKPQCKVTRSLGWESGGMEVSKHVGGGNCRITNSTFRLTGILVNQREENLQWVFITASDSKIQCWVVKTNLQASVISMSLNHPKMILAEKIGQGNCRTTSMEKNRSPTIVPNNKDMKRTDSTKLSLRISYSNNNLSMGLTNK